MLSIGAIKDSQGASHYFSKDDYYAKDDPRIAGTWHGLGAARLGLAHKAVELDEFKSMLEGKLPNGTELGRSDGQGNLQHKPGWDLTFSAPKSVSILALAGEDERLVTAHDRAVQSAMMYVERHAAVTRIREDGQVRYEHSGNLVWATFKHESNREMEPQLHSHNVVLNCTYAEGKWRSLESHEIYKLKMLAGEVYRSELAREVRNLGYEVQQTHKDGRFEIKGVPQDLISKFSERTKQIEEYLREHGLADTPQNRAQAALNTRQAKQEIPRAELVEKWKKEAAQYDLNSIKNRAQDRAQETQRQGQVQDISQGISQAEKSLNFAIESLSERECRFSHHQLIQEAMRHGFGRISVLEAESQIHREIKSGNLIERTLPDGKRGYTTKELIQIERQNIQMMRDGQGKFEQFMSPDRAKEVVRQAERASKEKGYNWTLGQRQAVLDVLTSRDRVQGIQGLAGTAKTSTVLATVAKEFHAKGWDVRLAAPTASATKQLEDAIGRDNCSGACTVQKFLIDQKKIQEPEVQGRQKLWIIDESSMLGTRQMNELLKHAEKQNAKVLLVGDVKQIASIEAGKAFGQLQEAGMRTSILDHIVRQKNPQLLAGVEAAAKGEMRNALEKVEQAGGIVEAQSEQNKMEEVISRAAQHYLSLSPSHREKTLVIATSRAARDSLNEQIRSGLKEHGVLRGPEVKLESLSPTGWTRAEMKHIANYDLHTQSEHTQADGLVVRFGRGYKSMGVEKGEYGRVVGINEEKGVVQLQMQDGRTIEWDPERAVKVEVFESREKSLSSGDVIRWTRNDSDLGIRNGETALIRDIQSDGIAKVQLLNGEIKEIDLNAQRHWDHGYAGTIFSAQGRTSESVIAIMPSNSPLSDQRSAYVAISRAKESAYLYTDSKSELQSALQERTGEPSTALENFSPFQPADLSQSQNQDLQVEETKLPHEESQQLGLEPADKEQVEQQAIEQAEQDIETGEGLGIEEIEEIFEEISISDDSQDECQEKEQEMEIGM